MTTALTVQTPNGPYEPSSDTTPIAALTWTAADTNGNTAVIPSKRVLVLAWNSGASSRTVQVTSSFDPYGRKADTGAFSIAAGEIAARFFEPSGWEQNFGARDLLITANHAEVMLAVIAV